MIKIKDVLKFSPIDSPEYYAAEGVLPQMLAAIVRALPLVKNEDGLISCSLSLAALKARVESDNPPKWNMQDVITYSDIGKIFQVFKHSKRSDFLPSKDAPNRLKSCVPLFLSAFKEYSNVPYSAWDLTDPKLANVTDPFNYALIEYYTSENQVHVDKDHFMRLRSLALTMGNGQVASDTLYKCNTTKVDKVFDMLPVSVRMCLLQVWLYHPDRANDYMIRNFNDIDSPAEYSLVPKSTDMPFIITEKKPKVKDTGDFIW